MRHVWLDVGGVVVVVVAVVVVAVVVVASSEKLFVVVSSDVVHIIGGILKNPETKSKFLLRILVKIFDFFYTLK